MPTQIPQSLSPPVRQWLARLDLSFQLRDGKTALTDVAHLGPLRVQRPFYPEGKTCCHVYLLHPPGGLVVGDELRVDLELTDSSHALVTTPSAGKLYKVPSGGAVQSQRVTIRAEPNSFIEWLPQETLVFDGADARLSTRVYLEKNAQLFSWDILCLGRPASELPFVSGRCLQTLEVFQDRELAFVEKNDFSAGHPIISEPWGLDNCHTSGTVLATFRQPVSGRDELDQLWAQLCTLGGERHWGLTRKKDLFIARYRGNSVSQCREGFLRTWQFLRPFWCNRPACVPRIWAT